MSEFLVVGVGDSITAGNPGWDPDPERRRLEDPGDDETSQYLYWAARANRGMRFVNHGVGGERTDEIRSRLEQAAQGADVIVVQGGINDVVQGRSVGLAADDLRAMVRRSQQLAPVVLLADVLPWNNGWPDAEPRIRELNALIAEIGASEGVPVLPFHETLEDAEGAGPHESGVDPGRQPPVRRGSPSARRARLPAALEIRRRVHADDAEGRGAAPVPEEVGSFGGVVRAVACLQDPRRRALELELELPLHHVHELLTRVTAVLGEVGARLELDDHRHHRAVRVRGEQTELDSFPGRGERLLLGPADDVRVG